MRKTFITAWVLGAAASAVLAQTPEAPARPAPAKPEPRAPKIAVIDMGRITSESLLGKGYAAQLDGLKNEIDAEGTKKQNELSKLDIQNKALQEELEKQQGVLSPEAADKKRQEIVRKTRERQAFLEDGQQELTRMRERAQQAAQALNQEFQQRIRPHIDAVAKDKGIDIILDNQMALTVSKDFDISQDVIVKADDAERAARAKAGAAKAAAPTARPAGPAAGVPKPPSTAVPTAPASAPPATSAPVPSPSPTPSPLPRP